MKVLAYSVCRRGKRKTRYCLRVKKISRFRGAVYYQVLRKISNPDRDENGGANFPEYSGFNRPEDMQHD